MCLFSLPVQHVHATKIFVRDVKPGTQLLVYEMSVEADADVAMILPLPNVDTHVSWVDMSECRDFFRQIEMMFIPPTRGGYVSKGRGSASTLAVERVGSFDASYVPTVADFGRLDERFRIPFGVFDLHPEYRDNDFGFAVFKLRDPTRGLAHPMALTFTRHPSMEGLFVPTTHAHGGEEVPTTETFDHYVYAQREHRPASVFGVRWQTSEMGVQTPRLWGAPKNEMGHFAKPGAPVHRLELRGEFENRDVVVV